MRIVLTDRAKADLRKLQSYIAQDNVTAAARVASTIRSSIEILATYPLIGTIYTDDVRRLNVTRYPYSVFYRADATAGIVTVLTIRHAAQLPPVFS